MARPVYERKSKLLFLEKMFNFDNSGGRQYKGKRETKVFGKRRKLKLPASTCKFNVPVDKPSASNKQSFSRYKAKKKPKQTLVDNKARDVMTVKCEDECDMKYWLDQDDVTNKQNVCNPQTHSCNLPNFKGFSDCLVGENDTHCSSNKCQEPKSKQTMNQEQVGNGYSGGVTVFAYRCIVCKKEFATLFMLQEHNLSQCGNIHKESHKQQTIECLMYSDIKILTEMHEMSKVMCVRCSLCRTYKSFRYLTGLKHHLLTYHRINVDLNVCSKYAIEGDNAGSARTREYLNSIHKENCVEMLPQQKQSAQHDKSSSLSTTCTSFPRPCNPFICRICDAPFSQFVPFLNHYQSHLHSTVPALPTVLMQFKSQSQSKIRTPSTGKGYNLDKHVAPCHNSLTCDESLNLEVEDIPSFSPDLEHSRICDTIKSDSQHININLSVEPEDVSESKYSNIHVKVEPEDDLYSVDSKINVKVEPDDALYSEHSKISVTVEGFEIELDQPSDDITNNADQDGEQLRESDAKLHEFICKICHKSYSNYVELLCHNKIHEILPGSKKSESNHKRQSPVRRKPVFAYSCPKCKLPFTTALSYSVHLRSHGKIFDMTSVDSLKNLVGQHWIPKQNTERTESKCTKTKHQTGIDNNKCKICLICSKSFLKLSSYKQHMTRHGFVNCTLKTGKGRPNFENDLIVQTSRYNASTVKKHNTRKKFKTNVDSMHKTSAENVVGNCVVTEDAERSEAIQLSVDDCKSKEFSKAFCEQGETENQLYNTIDPDGIELDGCSIQTKLIISNTFSLQDDSFANVDILTRMECEMAVKQEVDDQTGEDVHPQYILPENGGMTGDSFNVLNDDSGSSGKGNPLTEVKGCSEDSSHCRDTGKLASYKDGNEEIVKYFPETDGNIPMNMPLASELNSSDNVSTVTYQNDVNSLPSQLSKMKDKDPSKLQCEICSKIMPTLAFKRIHMLLHRNAVNLKK